MLQRTMRRGLLLVLALGWVPVGLVLLRRRQPASPDPSSLGAGAQHLPSSAVLVHPCPKPPSPPAATKATMTRSRRAVDIAKIQRAVVAADTGRHTDAVPASARVLPPGMEMVEHYDHLVVGYCDDGMQNFARDVARHIIPWKGVELLYVPDLGSFMWQRGVTDKTFINNRTTHAVTDGSGNALPSKPCRDGTTPANGQGCIVVPHILICSGWNYNKKLKAMREKLSASQRTLSHAAALAHAKPLIAVLKEEADAGSRAGDQAFGRWVDGVWWPESSEYGLRLARHRRRGRPLIMAMSDESWKTQSSMEFDIMLDTTRSGALMSPHSPSIYAPTAMTNWWRVIHSVNDLLRPSTETAAERVAESKHALASKTRFCAFMYNVCWRPGFSQADAVLRVALYDILHKMTGGSEKRKVHALSGCRGHHQDYHAYEGGRVKQTYMDAAVTMYHAYRFVITSENTIVPGYVTEKVVNTILAGAVPIYIGAPDIAQYINVKRMVHCKTPPSAVQELRDQHQKFEKTAKHAPNEQSENEPLVRWVLEHPVFSKTLRACAQEALDIDMDHSRYLEMASQPPLPGNTLDNTIWSHRYYGERIRQTLAMMDSDLLEQ